MNITNDIITAYIDSLYKDKTTELAEMRAFAEEHRVPIILKDTEGLLITLLKIRSPKRILEIGAAIGYSSSLFASVCDCEVVTIEADEKAFDIATSNIKNLGLDDRITVLKGDARDVLADLGDKEEKFDLVFIDAAKSHYREFWDLSIPLLNEDSVIICDNVLMKGMTASDEYDPKKKYKTSIRKMRDFIKYINDLDYADTCVIPVGDGVSISVIG